MKLSESEEFNLGKVCKFLEKFKFEMFMLM